jgi:hypothetical protein
VDFRLYGLVKIQGGTAQTSVVTLTRPGPLDTVPPLVAEVLHDEALWLAGHAVNNKMPPLPAILSREGLADFRARLVLQKIHAGRMNLAVLVYAYAMEPSHPDIAEGARNNSSGFGSLANFLGDETAMDYINDARFERLRENLTKFAAEVQVLRVQPLPSPTLDQATQRIFREYF